MANGDDAAAEGMDLVSGSASRSLGYDEINKTRDYIAQFFNAVKTWATSAFLAKSEAADAGDAVSGKLVRYSDSTRITTSYPVVAADAANKLYVDNVFSGIDTSNKVSRTGDTMTGDLTIEGSGNHLFVPNATAATSGYTVGYINSDGRLSRGASSRRYKHDIRDAQDLGDTFAAPLREFKMNHGDDSYRIGRIAEELVEAGLERYVVYVDGGDGVMIPDSIDFIAFLMAQNEQLHTYVLNLHARITALEASDE